MMRSMLRRLVQRPERHAHDDRRAIRHRDDALVILQVARVDFRHDQRHVGLHAKRGRIVDHHRARLLAGVGEFARAGRPGAEERVIDIGKRRGAQFLHRHALALRTRPSCPATATRRAA